MPVPAGAAAVLGVVGVDQGQSVAARRQVRQQPGRTVRGGQVVPGSEGVTGVQAHPRPRVPVEVAEVRDEISGGGAEHPALPGHRLQQQVRAIVGHPLQERQQAFTHAAHGRVTVSPHRRPGVHDHAPGADLGPAPQ